MRLSVSLYDTKNQIDSVEIGVETYDNPVDVRVARSVYNNLLSVVAGASSVFTPSVNEIGSFEHVLTFVSDNGDVYETRIGFDKGDDDLLGLDLLAKFARDRFDAHIRLLVEEGFIIDTGDQ